MSSALATSRTWTGTSGGEVGHPVLERGQADVLLERVVLAAEMLELQIDLLFDRQHPVGEQTGQAEGGSLVRRKRKVLRRLC